MRPSKWVQRGKTFVADNRLGDLILAEERAGVKKTIEDIEAAGKGTPDQWATIKYSVRRYEGLTGLPDTTMVPHMGNFRDYLSTMIDAVQHFARYQLAYMERTKITVIYHDTELPQALEDARTIIGHLDAGGYHVPAFDRVASDLSAKVEKMEEAWKLQSAEIMNSFGVPRYVPLSDRLQGYRMFL